MITIVIFWKITAPASKAPATAATAPLVAPGASGFSLSSSRLASRMPMPTSREKTISGSTLTSAITFTGLTGIIERTISRQSKGAGSGTAPISIPLVSRPMPGAKKVPSPRPSQTAIWPVTTNRRIARQPTLPSLPRSPIAVTPDTRLRKISGTISILMKSMKTSPTILMLSASSPQKYPTIAPSISASSTRAHNGVANQALNIHFPLESLAASSAVAGGRRQALRVQLSNAARATRA